MATSMLTVEDLVEEYKISHDQLKQRCSPEHLKATAPLVSNFTKFASKFEIPKSVLSDIKTDPNLGFEQKTEEVFLLWLANMKNATYQSFLEVCLKLFEGNVARKMCELCAATDESQAKTPNEQQPSASGHASQFEILVSRMSWMKSDILAPKKLLRPIDAVAYGDTAYFINFYPSMVYSFSNVARKWDKLPECLVEDTSLVVLPVTNEKGTQFLLHTVGGRNPINDRKNDQGEFSGVLYQLKSVREGTPATWQCSDYPDMTIKRSQVTVAYCDGYVIAAGGCSDLGVISKVEVLNILSPKPEWSRVISLPEPVFRASQCICKGFLYILGGNVRDKNNGCFVPTRSAYVIKLDKLIESLGQDEVVFEPLAHLRLKESAFVVCRNNVVAIEAGNLTQSNHWVESLCMSMIRIMTNGLNLAVLIV